MKIKSKGEFDEFFSKLDEQQKAAVEATTEGPVVVLAGPGSGKTRVLAARYAYLVNKKKVDPDSIVAVTFSTEMAKEMLSRILDICPSANEHNISTIHAFCKRLLKDEWFDKRSKVDDWKIRDSIRKVTDSFQWNVGWRTVRWWIDYAKMNGVGPDLSARAFFQTMHNKLDAERLSACYRAVKTMLDAEKSMTYVDMIADVSYNLKNDKEALSSIKSRIKYVLVDEGQDVFKMAIDILSMITENIFIVGDQDQLLYRFLGADPQNIYNLANTGELYKLETNYRSHASIVSSAKNLISHNYKNQTKYMKNLRAAGSRDKAKPSKAVRYNRFLSPHDEAEFVVKTICYESFRPAECFVAFRTNAQSVYVERELIKEKIPYVVRDGNGFFDRHHISDIMAYLRLAIDNCDDDAFMQVYNIPSAKLASVDPSFSRQRWLGKNFIRECESSSCLYHGMISNRLSPRHRDLSKDVAWMVANVLAYKNSPTEAVNFVIDECYLPYYLASSGKVASDPSDDDNIVEDLNTLKSLSADYTSVDDLVTSVKEMKKATSKKITNSSVVLSSIHKLKGLERNIVFCIGWSEGILPHSKSLGVVEPKEGLSIPNFGKVEDERCAAFVALTRAKSRVYVTSVETYSEGGQRLEPSRFITEMGLTENV